MKKVNQSEMDQAKEREQMKEGAVVRQPKEKVKANHKSGNRKGSGNMGLKDEDTEKQRKALRILLKEKLSEEDYEVLLDEDLDQIINAVNNPDDVLESD